MSALLDAVQRTAVQQGGQVFSSSTQESGDRPSGTVVVRVPAERFEALLLAVRGLAEVRGASSTGPTSPGRPPTSRRRCAACGQRASAT